MRFSLLLHQFLQKWHCSGHRNEWLQQRAYGGEHAKHLGIHGQIDMFPKPNGSKKM
jgi:hypothetical protein